MTTATEPFQRIPFSGGDHTSGMQRSIPILPSNTANQASPSGVDAMELTPSHNSSSSMGPPVLSSPNGDRLTVENGNGGASEHLTTNGSSAPAVGAAAVAQQPKVVQTAFIHKLYKLVIFCFDQTMHSLTQVLACWKINRYNTSYPGLVRMRVSSCLLLVNSPRCWREFLVALCLTRDS